MTQMLKVNLMVISMLMLPIIAEASFLKHCYSGDSLRENAVRNHFDFLREIEFARSIGCPIFSEDLNCRAEKILINHTNDENALFEFQCDPCGMRETNQFNAGLPNISVAAALMIQRAKNNRESFGTDIAPINEVKIKDVRIIVPLVKAQANRSFDQGSHLAKIEALEKELGL